MRGRATEYCDLIGPFNLGCRHKLFYTIVPDSIPVGWRVESGAETSTGYAEGQLIAKSLKNQSTFLIRNFSQVWVGPQTIYIYIYIYVYLFLGPIDDASRDWPLSWHYRRKQHIYMNIYTISGLNKFSLN